MRTICQTLAAAAIGLLAVGCGETDVAPKVSPPVAAAAPVPVQPSKPAPVAARSGDLKVESIGESGQALTLGPVIVFRREGGFLSIENRFHSGENDIALIRDSEGGSGTNDSYFFVTITPDSKTLVSDEFQAADRQEIVPKQLSDGIYIDLRYNKGMHEELTYREGKQLIKRTPLQSKKEPGNEDDCNYLYNEIYVAFVQARECNKDFEEDLAMSTVRAYDEISNDPHFSLDDFADMSKKSCATGSPMAYSEFKKRVCGY